MQESDREAFSECIEALVISFGSEASRGVFMAYWMGLCDLDLDEVQASVVLAIRESKSLPTPAELREKVVGKSEDLAIRAWTVVERSLGIGPYKHIDFEDRIINATIRNLGGWPTFLGRCTNATEEKWLRLEFLKTYRAMLSSHVSGEACAPLPGLSEQQVVGGKLGAPIPKRVGCDYTKQRRLGGRPNDQRQITHQAG